MEGEGGGDVAKVAKEGSGDTGPASQSRFQPFEGCQSPQRREALTRTVQFRRQVNGMVRKGAEEARNQLPDLLEAAEKGQSTIISRHGRPVVALVPISAYGAVVRQEPLTPLAGSGRGLWGRDSARTLRRLRDEWSR